MPDDAPRPKVTLETIVAATRRDVERVKAATPIERFQGMIEELGRPRNFFKAVTSPQRTGRTAVIAEIKRRSPSAGLLRPEYARDDFDPATIARRYQANGAAAISCLTNQEFFGGALEFIHRIRDACPLPVLRKDFIVDPWQVWQSRAFGADAILLIAECLNDSELLDLMILAHELQLTTLVEIHSADNLLRLRPHVGFPARSYMLLGINNRDLATMTVDLNHSIRLADLAEDKSIVVSESGIREKADLDRLRVAGIRNVLVGESLMREEDPGAALARLLGHAPDQPTA